MRNIPEERGRNMDAILWLAAVVVLLVIEIATLGLTTIWFAGGALIAGIAAVAGAGRVVQFVLFLIVIRPPSPNHRVARSVGPSRHLRDCFGRLLRAHSPKFGR